MTVKRLLQWLFGGLEQSDAEVNYSRHTLSCGMHSLKISTTKFWIAQLMKADFKWVTYPWRISIHWLAKIVTAIHMTVTAVWYVSNRLMTLLTQWDAWEIEYDSQFMVEMNLQLKEWRFNVTVWRSADECSLKRCWSGLETSAGMIWQWHVWKCVETVSFNYKCKLVLNLRLGYLKPFLAGSKKTRQGPGWGVGVDFTSRL